MMKGLRPLPVRPLPLPPGLRQRTLERMRSIVEESLNSEELDEKHSFVIDYLFTVSDYHLARDPTWKNRSYLKIQKDEKRGHQVGLNQEEITALNFIVLEEREKGQLESLFQKLKEKGAK